MRRGQVTIFVIIGLALLLIIGLFLMLRTPSVPEQTGRINAEPAVTLVQSCLSEKTKEGLLLIGRQGGYTSLDGLSYSEEQPWRGDVYVSGPQSVPYWYAVKDCENTYGCPQLRVPPLCEDECIIPSSGPNSIQEQLETYVAQHLDECLSFDALEALSVKKTKEPKVSVLFTADAVVANLELPLIITDTQSGDSVSLTTFTSKLDIDFEEIYRLATDIITLEQNTTFVEENLLHFLAIYSGLDSPLPPMNDAEFFGGTKYWLRSEVQDVLEQEILPYLNFMQVVNAFAGFNPVVDIDVAPGDEAYRPYADGVFLYSEINLGADKQYPDLGVNFFYPYSPIYLNINDREVLKGEKISSGNIFEKLTSFLITRYRFKYDIAFPLLVTVDDPGAFHGEGYQFDYAIEGNILNNRPLRIENRPQFDIRSDTFVVDPNDPRQRPSAVVELTSIDKHTDQPVPDAAITYDCGFHIAIGSTDASGVWRGTLPYCAFGGYLIVEKPDDYFSVAVPFNNDGNQQDTEIDAELWPVVEKDIIVMRRLVGANNISTAELVWDEQLPYHVSVDVNGSTHYNTSGVNLTQANNTMPFSQYAMVTLQREQGLFDDFFPPVNTFIFGKNGATMVQDYQLQQEHLQEFLDNGSLTQEEFDSIQTQMASWQTNQLELQRIKHVSLVPGTYDIQGFLFYQGNLTIPKEIRKVGPFWNRKKITLPEQSFTVWPQGGIDLAGPNAVEFTESDVYSNKTLIIYLLEQPLPHTWKELENYKSIDEYQNGKEQYAAPAFEEDT